MTTKRNEVMGAENIAGCCSGMGESQGHSSHRKRVSEDLEGENSEAPPVKKAHTQGSIALAKNQNNMSDKSYVGKMHVGDQYQHYYQGSLKCILELRQGRCFERGNLKITGGTFKYIQEAANKPENKVAFQEFNAGLVLTTTKIPPDALEDLLIRFTKIKALVFIVEREESNSKVLDSLKSSLQYYENLQELGLENLNLKGEEVLEIVDSLTDNQQETLQSINLKGNDISLSQIEKLFLRLRSSEILIDLPLEEQIFEKMETLYYRARLQDTKALEELNSKRHKWAKAYSSLLRLPIDEKLYEWLSTPGRVDLVYSQFILGASSFTNGEYDAAKQHFIKSERLPFSQFYLGQLYELLKDEGESYKWMEKAAQNGNAFAQFKLVFTRGRRENVDQFPKLLQEAADQGHAEAQALLGGLLYLDQNIEENKTKGLALLEMAAKKRNAPAHHLLGVIKEVQREDPWTILSHYGEALSLAPHMHAYGQAYLEYWRRGGFSTFQV